MPALVLLAAFTYGPIAGSLWQSLHTGAPGVEPVFTGFMRTRPSSTFWAWVYALLYFLQVGWPAWAGTANDRVSSTESSRARMELIQAARGDHRH